MNTASRQYFHFTSKARINKSINTLLGILQGIAIDREINLREIQFFQDWIGEHAEVRNFHPFNELIPVVENAIDDSILTDDEYQDIAWLCEKFTSQKYYDATTADIQRLHAILGGILADGLIKKKELKGLRAWLEEHDHLRTCYPYDEVDSIILNVMSDGKIDDDEQRVLLELFSEFIQICDDKIIKRPPMLENSSIKGVCAVCPEIVFEHSWFCFTGASPKYKRKDFARIINDLGGKFTNTVRKDLNYLIVGAKGNPCWAYACYGRKVETAVNLRKDGFPLQIVHENDFHDSIMDFSS